jgi:ribosomal protein S18 acetylase RimI-like enzyme
MIRTATPQDIAAIVGLAVKTKMFAADDAPFLESNLREHFDAGDDSDKELIVDTTSEDQVVGSTLWQPRAAADRVWDLTMIAVDPHFQGEGRGAAMMRTVETSLRAAAQRLLMVETSATAQYDHTREFYARLGYDEEARVRDYWEDGDDLVIFRKALSVAPPLSSQK